MLGLKLQHSLGLHGVVHGAYTVPQHHLPAGDLVDISTQVFIWSKYDLLVLGQRTHQLLGISRGAYQVRQSLDFGRAVHITDDHVAWVLGFELGEILCLAALGQRTTCLHVRQQHFAARIENLCRFGHEMNATEHNDVCRGLLGLLGQSETVANIVRQFLYLVSLVIVAEYYGIFFLF